MVNKFLRKIKIGELAFMGDGAHTKVERLDSGIPYLTAQNIKQGFIDYSNSTYISEFDYNRLFSKSENSIRDLRKDDILFSIIGTIGNLYLYKSGDKFGVSSSVAILRPKQELIHPDYLFWVLRSEYFSELINKRKGGSVQGYTNLPLIRDTEILVPVEIKEQIKIADFLNLIDSKISLNNRINAELEAMAKTIYDYWFVQFDFPDKKGKPYKASGGKMVWSEELKREIPEGWEVTTLGDKLDVQRGISYKGSELDNESGIPMINLNSFNLNGTFKPDGIKYFNGKYTDKGKTSAGDLLIASTDVTRNADIIGKAILVPNYYVDHLVYSMDIAKIIPKKGMTTSFLVMLFNSEHYHNYIKYYASGTLVLHLNIDGVRWYKTEIPDSVLLNRYHELYLPIAERISATQKENRKLTELRDWLLPMLMNGQIKIKDAEQESSFTIGTEDKLAMAAEPELHYSRKSSK